MPRYAPIWVEFARQQYDDLPADMRGAVARRVAQLLEDPTGASDAVYNESWDQWSVPLEDDGFLFYAVVPDRRRVILLRLVTGLR